MARSLNDKGTGAGHNSGMIDAALVQRFIDRLVSLEDDADVIKDDKKAVLAEAKLAGFPSDVLRQKVKELRLDEAALAKLRAKQDYRERLDVALGEFKNTPLGTAAKAAAEKWDGELNRAGIA
jgi:uncharacterized protein (UPF0335 family)